MSGRKGLTLVELVVVMVLLLFIGLSVGGLVRIVRDTEQSINRTSEMNQTGRVVLQRIASELSSALPMPVVIEGLQATSITKFGGTELMEAGTATSVLTFYHEDAADIRSGLDLDTIRFTTANADPRRSGYPQADTIEVAYYIDTDPQTPEQGLVRSVGTLPGLLPEDIIIKQPNLEILSDRVISLNFRFYDPEIGEWLDTWDYTDVLPALVEITIGIAPSPYDEFMAQLEKDKTAISFFEWLTTIVPVRVRSYPDPSVQQQQQQTFPLSGMQQASQPKAPQSQQPPQLPTPSQGTLQIPQQFPGTGSRPQQGGGQR